MQGKLALNNLNLLHKQSIAHTKIAQMPFALRAQYAQHPLLKRLFLLMEKKKSNLIVAADVDTQQKLVELIYMIGKQICGLKIHIDIIKDFDNSLITKLQQLAKQYEFLLIEDRKFCDIGSTVYKQYKDGIYKIVEWADIIIAHVISGPDIIKGLKKAAQGYQRGLLLIAQMSTFNNLITTEYTQKVVTIAQKHQDFVIGFIAQEQCCNSPSFIVLTPGIHFIEQQNLLGQSYKTPEQAILYNNSDIIIVGRGIYQAKNPRFVAESYRKAAWKAYCTRLHSHI